jgi:hypothetical protein
MLFFTHMLVHSAIIGLGAIAQATPSHATSSVYEQRASQAAADMARLVYALPSISCFKAHPFLPNTLATAVLFLQAQPTPIKMPILSVTLYSVSSIAYATSMLSRSTSPSPNPSNCGSQILDYTHTIDE